MKLIKGFKGKYFSLAAIAATANAVKLHAQKSNYTSCCLLNASKEGKSDSPPDPELLESIPCQVDLRKNPVAKKACHCSIVFLQRTQQLFHHLSFFIKKLCPCRKTKSGLAPPLYSFFF